MERLEGDLIKARGDAYGEIWKLTGSINLFGPAIPASCAEFSAQLTDWYFAHGWVLTQEAKKKYFLVQEVLNFLRMRSIPIRRPADEHLFSDSVRPIEILGRLRTKEVQLAPARRGRRLLNRRNGSLRQRMEVTPKGNRIRGDKARTGLDRASIRDERVPLPPCSGTWLEG